MTTLGMLAVQADVESDTPITIRQTGEQWAVSLGGTDARITLYGRPAALRRLAAAILAALPAEDQEQS